MAKACWVARERKRKRLVKQHGATRAQLRERQADLSLSEEERQQARFALSRLPRDSSPSRRRNRCMVSGYSRSYLRDFGLSRRAFRELALRGELPGVTKSSW
ncbi:MAG: 30S ribosomal protein S14 [Myxococcota bacterium]